eukprot:CAMPEP_0197706596 /NCGR_PEP_ID=MMETSP1338-20131121/127023_1 /TAXON_ID=43686 ORGANISM="Pelagodinium beii, Strain RCC1491" /NCGR_SAMPLE_ID=MMETSP1338 /ASSEMBLY_ACC=CAM_ASM_000754 /LENGTH=162 /DNA_ID=CAMNT_0043290509 /DNA_START=1188 /DNA_END=1676 /DNA_ORIENTATION=-
MTLAPLLVDLHPLRLLGSDLDSEATRDTPSPPHRIAAFPVSIGPVVLPDVGEPLGAAFARLGLVAEMALTTLPASLDSAVPSMLDHGALSAQLGALASIALNASAGGLSAHFALTLSAFVEMHDLLTTHSCETSSGYCYALKLGFAMHAGALVLDVAFAASV